MESADMKTLNISLKTLGYQPLLHLRDTLAPLAIQAHKHCFVPLPQFQHMMIFLIIRLETQGYQICYVTGF